MTPAWDWTRFDALRAKLHAEYVHMSSVPPVVAPGARDVRGYRQLGRLRGRVADARHALENGQPVVMRKDMPREELVAMTPDAFVDAWEQGWRP